MRSNVRYVDEECKEIDTGLILKLKDAQKRRKKTVHPYSEMSIFGNQI